MDDRYKLYGCEGGSWDGAKHALYGSNSPLSFGLTTAKKYDNLDNSNIQSKLSNCKTGLFQISHHSG